jgi:hypothetical protein
MGMSSLSFWCGFVEVDYRGRGEGGGDGEEWCRSLRVCENLGFWERERGGEERGEGEGEGRGREKRGRGIEMETEKGMEGC